jgi:hypothetical protein
MILAAVVTVMDWSAPTSVGAADILNAAAVFERHFAAIGGRAAVGNVQSLAIQGVGQEGSQTFRFEITLKAPSLILFVARNDHGLEIRQGRDAQARAWRKYPEGMRDLNELDAGELMNAVLGFHLPCQLSLSQRLAQAPCQEERKGDRALVGIGTPGGPGPQLRFDPASGLLVRVGDVTLEDYRETGGVRLPFTVRPNARTTFRVETVRLNPPVTDALFQRPEGQGVDRPAEGPTFEYHTQLSPAGQLAIVRRPGPADFGRGPLAELPRYRPGSSRHWQVDVRGYDLTQLDLTDRLADLRHADFDSQTRWPEKVPAGFDPARIVELGKDPGLGVRQLHARGITGRGVALGIIDQTLLVDHVEYRDQIRLYEEIHAPAGSPSEMHGPAVASIAVGKTTGVAPDAALYYIAETHGTLGSNRRFDWDFTWLAQSIERLLEVNASLPSSGKIRVISISVGWSPDQKGYRETMAAVEKAKQAGVFIVSTALEHTHHLAFHGLGREALADPNTWTSYMPGSWWAGAFWAGQGRFAPGQRLLAPMDSRTLASPTGLTDWVHYDSGGWSWTVPWIAGLYALACQVRPDLTPELFWAEALQTGRTIRLSRAGVEVDFGTLADPVALVEKLQRGPARAPVQPADDPANRRK